MNKSKSTLVDDYIKVDLEDDSKPLITIGVCDIFLHKSNGSYHYRDREGNLVLTALFRVVNSRTQTVPYSGPSAIQALVVARDEANAWLTLCETKRTQDLEEKTGLVLPDHALLVPEGHA